MSTRFNSFGQDVSNAPLSQDIRNYPSEYPAGQAARNPPVNQNTYRPPYRRNGEQNRRDNQNRWYQRRTMEPTPTPGNGVPAYARRGNPQQHLSEQQPANSPPHASRQQGTRRPSNRPKRYNDPKMYDIENELYPNATECWTFEGPDEVQYGEKQNPHRAAQNAVPARAKPLARVAAPAVDYALLNLQAAQLNKKHAVLHWVSEDNKNNPDDCWTWDDDFRAMMKERERTELAGNTVVESVVIGPVVVSDNYNAQPAQLEVAEMKPKTKSGRPRYKKLDLVEQPIIGVNDLPEHKVLSFIDDIHRQIKFNLNCPMAAINPSRDGQNGHQELTTMIQQLEPWLLQANQNRAATLNVLWLNLDAVFPALAHELAIRCNYAPTHPDGSNIALIENIPTQALTKPAIKAAAPARNPVQVLPNPNFKLAGSTRAEIAAEKAARAVRLADLRGGGPTERIMVSYGEPTLITGTDGRTWIGAEPARDYKGLEPVECGEKITQTNVLSKSPLSPVDSLPKMSNRFEQLLIKDICKLPRQPQGMKSKKYKFWGKDGTALSGVRSELITALRMLQPYWRAHAVVNTYHGKRILVVLVSDYEYYQNATRDRDVFMEVENTDGIVTGGPDHEDLNGNNVFGLTTNVKTFYFPEELRILADEIALRSHLDKPLLEAPCLKAYNAELFPEKPVVLSNTKYKAAMKEAQVKKLAEVKQYMENRNKVASDGTIKARLDTMPAEIRALIFGFVSPTELTTATPDMISKLKLKTPPSAEALHDGLTTKIEIKHLSVPFYHESNPMPDNVDPETAYSTAKYSRQDDESKSLDGPGLTSYMYRQPHELPSPKAKSAQGSHGKLPDVTEHDIDSPEFADKFFFHKHTKATVLRRKQHEAARLRAVGDNQIGAKPVPHDGKPCTWKKACQTSLDNGDKCGSCDRYECSGKITKCPDCRKPKDYAQRVYDDRVTTATNAVHNYNVDELYKQGKPVYNDGLQALSMTCKLFHNDLVDEVFSKYKFSFGSPTVLMEFISSLTPVACASIRHLAVHFKLELQGGPMAGNAFEWKFACQLAAAKFPNLKGLEYRCDVNNLNDYSGHIGPSHKNITYPTGFVFSNLSETTPWYVPLSQFKACKQLEEVRLIVQPDHRYKYATQTAFPALTKALNNLLAENTSFDEQKFTWTRPSKWMHVVAKKPKALSKESHSDALAELEAIEKNESKAVPPIAPLIRLATFESDNPIHLAMTGRYD